MKITECIKCGRKLLPGKLKYKVHIEVYADYDGIIPEEDTFVDLNQQMKNIAEKTKGLPASLIEEEVHREFDYILCKECKLRYSANPMDLPLDNIKIPNGVPIDDEPNFQ